MPHVPLQSIRGRIFWCLALSGFGLILLVIVAMNVAADLPSMLLFFGLILLLFAVLAWHLSSYLMRDVGTMASRMTEIETAISSLKKENKRSAQETEEATDTLSDFMYYIAHTLRTPLNAIRWSVETLKNEDAGQVNEEQRELLDKLEYSTVKLASVASELQDALIVMRGEPLHMRPLACKLEAIVDEAAGRWAVAVRRKGLRLDWKHPERVHGKIFADPERVSQVVNILLDNAIRYSRGEGKTIQVRVLALSGKESAAERKAWKVPPGLEHALVLAVRDEGIGIGTEERDRIFNAFFRGGEARGIWVDGKGIGLTLTKAVMEGMNGDVWFTSAKGKGTSMYVAFPLA